MNEFEIAILDVLRNIENAIKGPQRQKDRIAELEEEVARLERALFESRRITKHG